MSGDSNGITSPEVTEALQSTHDELKPRIQSAKRSIELLLEIARSQKGLRVKELSDQLGMPRQIVYRLLHTLESTGLVRKSDQNRYVLGLAAARISEGFLRQLARSAHRPAAPAHSTAKEGSVASWLDSRPAFLSTARGRSAIKSAELLAEHDEFSNG